MGLISRVSSRTYRYFYTPRKPSEAVINLCRSTHSPSNMSEIDSETLQRLLKCASAERKVTKGLNEVARGLEQRHAVACFLAGDVKEEQYSKLIESLARDAQVPLLKVDSGKTLGQWVGLCKYDEEGEVRKVVGCGCVVIKDWPVTAGDAVEKFKAAI